MIKKLLSYIIPITISNQKSSISQTLEFTWMNGKLVLDSKNTNYYYESLQLILRTGLKSIGFKKINQTNTVLVLVVDSGNVIKNIGRRN